MWVWYLLFYVVAQGSVRDLEAVVGGVARLPCDLNPPSDDTVTLVIWYKEGLLSPIYSLDARERIAVDQGTHWSEDNVVGNRGFFAVEGARSLLSLEPVRETDAGQYKCRVDFHRSPTRNSFINLSVIIPPRKIGLYDANGSPLTKGVTAGSLPPFTEGSSLKLICIATGGKPSPRVSWWLDEEVLDSTDEAVSDKRVRNTLHIETINRSHQDRLLTCKASNNQYQTPLTATVSIDMFLRPLEVKLVGRRGNLRAGTSYEIGCQSSGSRPPPTITWWKGAKPLRNNAKLTTSSDGNVTTSIISLTPTATDSGLMLLCKASNPHLPSATLEDNWLLQVEYPPIVSMELGSNLNGSSIVEGVDVYFDCNIKANPWVNKVMWMRGETLVTNNPMEGIIVSNQTLVLQSVTRHNSGHYSCAASNNLGRGRSQPFHLHVKYEPECLEKQQRVYGAARLEEIRVTCEVDSNPPPISFLWTFNNSVIKERQIKLSNFTDLTSQTIYKPISETDYGTLLCRARNELGLQKSPCIYHVVPAGRPDTPQNCSATNRSLSWIQISCVRGFDGGLPQELVAEANVRGRTVVNVTAGGGAATTFQIHIPGLEPGTEYALHVYSINGKGKSDPALLTVNTLGQSNQPHRRVTDGPMLVLEPVMFVSGWVTLACLLMGGAVVLVLLLRRLRRHRPHLTPQDNSSKTAVKTVSMPVQTQDDEPNPDVIPHSDDGVTPVVRSSAVAKTDFSCDTSFVCWDNGITATLQPVATRVRFHKDTQMWQ